MVVAELEPRIIPAYAGSTESEGLADELLAGSSPHTRGALDLDGFSPCGGGIIPAYAGSTFVVSYLGTRTADHPRIRGEHAASTHARVTSSGSSPHTRGAPDRVASSMAHAGIIPAYAGSTSGPCSDRKPFKDHPRIRGEHARSEPRSQNGGGSSPHTRGAPFLS